MSKKQQDLESIPEPEIKYVDMKDEEVEQALTIAKNAFLAKQKGSQANVRPNNVSRSARPSRSSLLFKHTNVRQRRGHSLLERLC